MKVTTYFAKYPGDLVSPISMYLALRDHYPCSCLLECSEYKQAKNGSSIIGFDAISEITLNDLTLSITGGLAEESEVVLGSRDEAVPYLSAFLKKFDTHISQIVGAPTKAKPVTGLFGYLSYDAVTYFDSIELNSEVDTDRSIPVLQYRFYRYFLQLNHASNELLICKNVLEDESTDESELRQEFDRLYHKLVNRRVVPTHFEAIDEEFSNFTDEEYALVVRKCREHIYRGDVFQIVPSRRFSQKYAGDDFLVYRALRSINPSPYLFYFDCGDFRLFGSSPEALLVIEDGVASSFPIAGTRFRSGDDDVDAQAAADLLRDEKENAEHVMLVDLARNDLSRFCDEVKVTSFCETQFYSHVIHLVSLVQGKLLEKAGPFELLKAVFPAGTLSGAPKYRAMELIDTYERGHRSYYAGAVGFVEFGGNVNHAIMIRTFLSKNSHLYCQAGGGIVEASNEADEVQEVKNKLAALKRAVEVACAELDIDTGFSSRE